MSTAKKKVMGMDLSPTGSSLVTLLSADPTEGVPKPKKTVPPLLPLSKILLNRGRSGGRKADEHLRGTGIENLYYVASNLGHELQAQMPDVVVLEDYSGGGTANPFTLALTGEVTGAAKLWMKQLGIPWVEVAAATVKKFVTGSGKGGKEQIPLGAFKRWGVDPGVLESGDDNILDAYCLARLGLWFLFPDGATAGDREALSKLRVGGSPRPSKKRKGKE